MTREKEGSRKMQYELTGPTKKEKEITLVRTNGGERDIDERKRKKVILREREREERKRERQEEK